MESFSDNVIFFILNLILMLLLHFSLIFKLLSLAVLLIKEKKFSSDRRVCPELIVRVSDVRHLYFF